MGYFFFLTFDDENDSFHLDKMERQVRMLSHSSILFPSSPPHPRPSSLSLSNHIMAAA